MSKQFLGFTDDELEVRAETVASLAQYEVHGYAQHVCSIDPLPGPTGFPDLIHELP
jgi:hypothetical protein